MGWVFCSTGSCGGRAAANCAAFLEPSAPAVSRLSKLAWQGHNLSSDECVATPPTSMHAQRNRQRLLPPAEWRPRCRQQPAANGCRRMSGACCTLCTVWGTWTRRSSEPVNWGAQLVDRILGPRPSAAPNLSTADHAQPPHAHVPVLAAPPLCPPLRCPACCDAEALPRTAPRQLRATYWRCQLQRRGLRCSFWSRLCWTAHSPPPPHPTPSRPCCPAGTTRTALA